MTASGGGRRRLVAPDTDTTPIDLGGSGGLPMAASARMTTQMGLVGRARTKLAAHHHLQRMARI